MRPAEPLDIPLDGRCLVEASAGTGKTFTIALLYVRLVMEKGLGADQILVVTYTRAAAAELRERIRARLKETAQALETRLGTGAHPERGPHSKVVEMVDASIRRGAAAEELERLLRALRGFDEAAISTIHGFCQRMLDENAFESGVAFGTELVADQTALVEDVVADFWTRNLYDADPDFVAWLRSASHAGAPIGPRLLAGLADTVARYPRISVLPEQVPDAAADLDRRRAALARVRQIWQTDGSGALDLLVEAATDGVLNKRSFTPDKIRSLWAAEIDGYLGNPRVGDAAPKQKSPSRTGFARIARSHVEAKANKGKVAPVHPLFEAAEELALADAQCVDAFESRWLGLELSLIAYTRAELARRRRAARTRSFDELLTALADALEGEGGDALAAEIHGRFPAALIDEFQDTDPVQYAIFRRVWSGGTGSFFLIGDPKQAIYGFRGADVFAYMKAKDDAGADTVSLARNWRSDPSVIAGVNALFGGFATPFLYDAIPFQEALPAPGAVDRLKTSDGQAGLRIVYMPRGNDRSPPSKGPAKRLVSAVVADDIAALLASGATIDDEAVTASDVAVLCRTNDQARSVQDQLRRRGVPSVMQTQQSVFETDEAAALERLLGAAAEPGNAAAIRSAITTRWVGIDAAMLEAIDAEVSGLDPWLEHADVWSARLREAGALALVEHILHAHGSRERLIGEIGGERRLTNLIHLAELMQANAKSGPANPRAQLRWLARMRRDAAARAEQAGDDAIVRLESDARAVQLVTIHRSKGLQYGIVYCPFLWDGRLLAKRDQTWARFHDPDAGDALTLDLGSASHASSVARSRYEAFAESLRLLYVALTRAKHRVVVAWGAVNQGDHAALGFLLHPPPDAAGLAQDRDPELLDVCTKHFKSLSDEAMQADLEALTRRADGAISVEPVALSDVPRTAPGLDAGGLHPARTMTRRVTQRRRVSSFSRLIEGDGAAAQWPGTVAGAGVPDEHPAALGRDYDATSTADAMLAPSDPLTGTPVTLHAFPAGAGPGTLIHSVLERLDFTSPSRAAIESVCEEELVRAGMARGLAPLLAVGLREALDTPLGGPLGRFSLGSLERSSRIDEMEFALPVALDDTAPLTPGRLASAFLRHATSPDVALYVERVAKLGFRSLSGHLRGFVDLIFRHDDRYYVVDYKSNHLGAHLADYAPARLVDEMIRHDYTLQYHLYAVALHRHLAARLPDYAFERHFGGVYYLFVRGMSPATGPLSGVHHDRPSDALITALSDALGAGEWSASGKGAA